MTNLKREITDYLIFEVIGEDMVTKEDITFTEIDSKKLLVDDGDDQWVAVKDAVKSNPMSRKMTNGYTLQYLG